MCSLFMNGFCLQGLHFKAVLFNLHFPCIDKTEKLLDRFGTPKYPNKNMNSNFVLETQKCT